MTSLLKSAPVNTKGKSTNLGEQKNNEYARDIAALGQLDLNKININVFYFLTNIFWMRFYGTLTFDLT